jgi:opacity protein-like surface antigen
VRSLACCRILAAVASCVAIAVFAPKVAYADPSSTTLEQGYDLGEIQHPRAVGMGNAQQVFGGSTTAVFVNPANLPLYRVYHLEGLAALSPEARRQSYGGAIADSSTSRLAGGLGGTWSMMDPDGIKRQSADLRLAIAYPVTERLSLGVTGRYLRVAQKVSAGPLGASLASDGTPTDPLFSGFTFDAGAGVQITENFRAALSGRNLTAPGTSLAPVALAGGLGWSNQTITVEADSLVDFTTFGTARARAMLGFEFLAADRFPLRVGYRYEDGMKTHALSLGAGYVDRKFSIELGGRRDVVAEHPATLLSLGIRFFIDAGSGASSSESGGDSF